MSDLVTSMPEAPRDVRVIRTDDVPLGQVYPSPHQPRKTYDPLVIRSLVESIEAVGVLQRPRVREHDDGFELVFGHQRVEACRQLGHQTIPVEVITCSDITARRMTLHENIKSTRLHPIEHAEAIVNFLDATLNLDPRYTDVRGETPTERVSVVLERLTKAPEDPAAYDPVRSFAADKEALVRQIIREMANKEPKSFLSADVSLLQLPDQILLTTVEKGLNKGHARALGQLLAREPNKYEEVIARGVPVHDDAGGDDAWIPLEKSSASAIRNLYNPPRPKRDFNDDEPREMAADRRYIPIGVPGRAEPVAEARIGLDDGEALPWEDDPVTPVFGLPLASLEEAHGQLTTLSASEWVAMILESGPEAAEAARAQWAAIARIANEVHSQL